MQRSIFSANRIYLIGYMASGKSTVGAELADQLGFLHFDTDRAIEGLAGMTISEIFEQRGESEFRDYEDQMLELMGELDKVVISTGGGMPMNQGAIGTMLRTGLTIYLECELDELVSRILPVADRPLHTEEDPKTLRESINARLSHRYRIYQEAHICMDSTDLASVTSRIIERL